MKSKKELRRPLYFCRVKGDLIAFENKRYGSKSMRLSMVALAVSDDTKSSILLSQESYFSTAMNMDRVGLVLIKVLL